MAEYKPGYETRFKAGSEQTETAREGGRASGRSRKAKRTLKDQLETLLALPLSEEETKAALREMGLKDRKPERSLALALALYQEALKGNVKAFEVIRDTIGQKPSENFNVNTTLENIEVVILDEEGNEIEQAG